MFKALIGLLWKNAKLEMLCYIICAGVLVCFKRFANLTTFLMGYFTADRISDVSGLFSITIGVYIAVVTILATSVIGISQKLLKANRDKDLLFVISIGLIQNITAVVIGVFSPKWNWVYAVYLSITFAAIFSFIKFLYLMLLIFKANMSQMAQDIDEESQRWDCVVSTLKQIEQNTRK